MAARICPCRSPQWNLAGECCSTDGRSSHDVTRHLLGGLTSDSGAAAIPPVPAAVPGTTPVGPHASAAVGPTGHHRPGARRSEGTIPEAWESARPDHNAPGPRDDPAPVGGVSSSTPPTPWYCVDHDCAHDGDCPALTPPRKPFLTWLLDKIGRPA